MRRDGHTLLNIKVGFKSEEVRSLNKLIFQSTVYTWTFKMIIVLVINLNLRRETKYLFTYILNSNLSFFSSWTLTNHICEKTYHNPKKPIGRQSSLKYSYSNYISKQISESLSHLNDGHQHYNKMKYTRLGIENKMWIYISSDYRHTECQLITKLDHFIVSFHYIFLPLLSHILSKKGSKIKNI